MRTLQIVLFKQALNWTDLLNVSDNFRTNQFSVTTLFKKVESGEFPILMEFNEQIETPPVKDLFDNNRFGRIVAFIRCAKSG